MWLLASGINMDAVRQMGEVIKETAERTADRDGIGCAKLVVFANAPRRQSIHGWSISRSWGARVCN